MTGRFQIGKKRSMKRLLMSFVAVLAAFSGSQAQSFEFRMDGEPVADGATVEFHAEEDELFHTYSCETGSRLALYNTSDAVINSIGITYSAVSGSLGEGVVPQICMGGGCQTQFPITYTATMPCFVGGSVATSIHVDNCQEGELLTRLDVTAAGESRTVYIKFVCDGTTGIAPLQSAAEADVYDISGNLVCRRAGAAALSALRPGVYIVKEPRGGEARKYVVR